MKKINIVSLIMSLFLFLPLMASANDNLDSWGFNQGESEIEGCYFTGSECAPIGSVERAICGLVDIASTESAADTVSCFAGVPDNSTSYFRSSEGDLNNYGHYCQTTSHRVWCHRAEPIPNPVCGQISSCERSANCFTGSASDAIEQGSNNVWICRNSYKSQICQGQDYVEAPKIACGSQMDTCNNGVARYSSETSWDCEKRSEYNTDYYACDSNLNPTNCTIKSSDRLSCGDNYAECNNGGKKGDTIKSGGVWTYTCAQQRIGDNETTMSCNKPQGICGETADDCDLGKSTNGNLGSSTYTWRCDTENGTDPKNCSVQTPSCNNSTYYSCFRGTPSDGSPTAPDGGTWICNLNGLQSEACSKEATPGNPSCGSSDGDLFYRDSPPDSNLCSQGSPSSVTNTIDTYDWRCVEHGESEYCQARRAPRQHEVCHVERQSGFTMHRASCFHGFEVQNINFMEDIDNNFATWDCKRENVTTYFCAGDLGGAF